MDGNPQIILMDIGSAAWKLDEFKQELWEKTNIGVPHLDVEANDSIILGSMVAEFLSEVSRHLKKGVIIFLYLANWRFMLSDMPSGL